MSTPTPAPAGMAPAGVDPDLADARADLRIRLNQIVGRMSGRSDVLLTVLWDRPDITTPAWFTPKQAEITLNGDIALAGADPDDIDPTTEPGRLANPVIAGLTAHESAHARSTRWTTAVTADTPRLVVEAATLLEEPRIEAGHIRHRPQDRVLLRAATRHIILADRPDDATDGEDLWRAATAVALILGRVEAGILSDTDAAPAMPALRDALGDDRLTQLRELIRAAVALDDDDAAGLLDIAARWVSALDLPPDSATGSGAPGTRMPGAACGSASTILDNPGPGAPAAGSGAGSRPGGFGESLTIAVAAVAADTSDDAHTEAAARADDLTGADREAAARAEAEAAARAEARAAEATARREADTAAALVFGHGYSPTGGGRSPITGWRAPAPAERAAVNKLATALRHAQFRERDMSVVDSPIPPGRLIGRAAMQQAAQTALGLPVTAAPFRQTIRRATTRPQLRIGIMVDVSGSMGWATGPMATAMWILTNAVHRIGGRAATTAFGYTTTPISSPGRLMPRVPILDADDGTEEFIGAATALDGALNLATGHGARLLVAVTDGQLVGPGQRSGAERIIARLTAAGTGVLHIGLDNTHTRPLPGATHLNITDPADSARLIAAAAVKALQAAH